MYKSNKLQAIKSALTIRAVIGKLLATACTLKTFAIQRQTNRLTMAAERIDQETELAEKRLAFAREVELVLRERAATKMADGITKANDAKRKAGKELDELNAL